MRRSPRSLILATTALLGLISAQSCEDATTVKLVEIDATGIVFGQAYLDANGNGRLDPTDLALRRVPVVLTVAQGGQVVSEAETDTTGFFTLRDVPVGSYRLGLEPGALGDSLQASGGGTELKIQLGDTTRVDFGVSYPILTLDQVLSTAVGRRVFTSGIVLNPRLPFGDGVVHFQSDSTYLRATNVVRSSINVGDSVRLLGRVKLDQGRPVLDNVTPVLLIASATIPVPVELSTAEASTARGGPLDAALIRVRQAEISDTATVGGLFRFRLDDGSGKVDAVFPAFLQLNNAAMRPDTIVRINQLTGLLVPVLQQDGTSRWRIYPRASGDVVLELKQADLSVKTTVSPAAAIKGESFVFTVVVSNAGPLGASGVQITDSVPQNLTFTSATASRGSYNASTGIWNLDSLKVGGSDTLKITASVNTDLVGTGVNQARVSRLLREVDPVPGNDVAAVAFNIESKLSDLDVQASVDKVRASRGDTLDFTVVLKNNGPREALGVQVSDSVPFGLDFISATATRGSYDAPKGLWDVGTVPVDAVDTLRFKAVITTTQVGSSQNRARVSRIQQGADPNSTNNLAVVNFTIETKASDLGVHASVTPDTLSRTDTLQITVVLTNAGPRAATGVQVTDSVPAGLTFRSATATRGTYDAVRGLWDVGDVPVGASDTLRIWAEVTTGQVGQGLNVAVLSRLLGGGDPDTTNNTSTAVFTVVPIP